MSLLDHCYCINLDSRPDRWEESVKEFDRVGLNVKRWRAVEASTSRQEEIDLFYRKKNQRNFAAEVACFKSHLSIIEYARDRKFKEVTIFEDDVVFLYDDFVKRLKKLDFHLPFNWTCVSYGVLAINMIPYGKNKLFTILNSFVGAHSYSINSKVYNYILNKAIKNNLPYDKFLSNIFGPTKKGFFINPPACIQRQSYSDISDDYKDQSVINGITMRQKFYKKL